MSIYLPTYLPIYVSIHLSRYQIYHLACIFQLFLFCFIFFGDTLSLCHLGWSVMAQSHLSATSASWVQKVFCFSLLSSWDYRHHYHTQLSYVFLVETGFRHVSWADLELLTLGDPPASASQSVGITGVSHHSRPVFFFLIIRFTPCKSLILVICVISSSKSHSVATSTFFVSFLHYVILARQPNAKDVCHSLC